MTNEELAVKAKDGDQDALLELWKQNSGLIYLKSRSKFNAVQLFGRYDVDLDDLMQSAFLGLWEAVERFEPGGEYTFTAYLNTTLKTALAEATGGRTKRQLRDPLNTALSLDVPLDDDDPDGATLEAIVPDPKDAYSEAIERIWREQLHAEMEKALNRLEPDHRTVLRLRFYEGLNREAIAAQMGMSESAVRTLEGHALAELRKPRMRRGLEDYIDLHTNFYAVGSWERQESPVEFSVVRREELRERYARRFEREPATIPAL